MLVQLVHRDPVTKVEDGVIVFLAVEHNSDIKSDKYVIVGWTGSHRESVDEVLFSDQELDLSPGSTPDETSLFLDFTELSV